MIRQSRTFGVGTVETVEELAGKLTETTWTLCTGFRFQRLLFLNDSSSEDAAQEYAVIRESDMCQLESITFSWCDGTRAIAYIKECLEITDDGYFGKLDPPPKVEPTKHHHCGWCA